MSSQIQIKSSDRVCIAKQPQSDLPSQRSAQKIGPDQSRSTNHHFIGWTYEIILKITGTKPEQILLPS